MEMSGFQHQPEVHKVMVVGIGMSKVLAADILMYTLGVNHLVAERHHTLKLEFI